MSLLDFMFKLKRRKIKAYRSTGAVLIDVREEHELSKGRIEDSINIPLNELQENIERLKALDKPIITFCESGIRSARAAKMLKLKKLDAINGGGWKFLQKLL